MTGSCSSARISLRLSVPGDLGVGGGPGDGPARTRATALGLFLESIGNNATASRYAGLNARSVKVVAYVWCGLCAGLAGLVKAADIRAGDVGKLGLNMELDAILAAAIGGASLAGGRFSLLGSLIGALVIQSLTTSILMHDIQPEWSLVVKAAVVILVCLLQSEKFRLQQLRRMPAAGWIMTTSSGE